MCIRQTNRQTTVIGIHYPIMLVLETVVTVERDSWGHLYSDLQKMNDCESICKGCFCYVVHVPGTHGLLIVHSAFQRMPE